MKTDEDNITVRFLPHKFLPKESQKKIWYASGQKYFFFGSCVDFDSFWKSYLLWSMESVREEHDLYYSDFLKRRDLLDFWKEFLS